MRWLRQLFVPTFVVSSSRLSSVVSIELSRDHGTGDSNEDRCEEKHQRLYSDRYRRDTEESQKVSVLGKQARFFASPPSIFPSSSH